MAFMQNAWFKDPEKAQAIFDRHPDRRNKLIASFLFAGGGFTGRRLMAALGAELCGQILWAAARESG